MVFNQKLKGGKLFAWAVIAGKRGEAYHGGENWKEDLGWRN